MDVAALLRLNIRRRGPGYVYVDCPVCGDRRGKMNLNLTRNVWRCNYCGEGGGMLSLYAKVYGVSNSTAYREICEVLQTEGFVPEHTAPEQPHGKGDIPQAERAPAREVHQTLSMLLSMLVLSPAHREHLRKKRGLSDAQIDAFGFRSTPPPYLARSYARRLAEQGCTLQGVPGFYLDSGGRWTIKFHPRTAGIMIPVKGVDGLIQGIQIRLDHPLKDKDDPPEKEGTKYLWLASTGKNMGTSSGSPVHFVGDPCARVVYVTEGPLKADIAHALMDRTFAAIAGANNVAQLDPLFRFLSKNGTEEIIEAQDMDKYRNKMVDKGASKIYLTAQKYGMACRRLTWNPNYKGIDDWQLALRRRGQKSRENRTMTFKEQYLNGLCGMDQLDRCAAEWRQKKDGSELAWYLGLTREEYEQYVQSGELKDILDSQRRTQRFRIYQLNLEGGETRAFAFSGIDALHRAGYQQPPAADYRLVCDGSIICPRETTNEEVLERIFVRYNDILPADYHGRSVSPSDVVELYDESGRTYFYCDRAGFVPVQFSSLLAKQGEGPR